MAIFWVVAGAMVTMVAALLALAMRRGSDPALSTGFDLQVYRDQMREVERAQSQGEIAAEESERLKAEVARRILAADRDRNSAKVWENGPTGATVLAAVLAVLIGTSIATYSVIGRPDAPDLPLAQRLAAAEEIRQSRPGQAAIEASAANPVTDPADPQHAALIAQLREVVAQRPDDIQGQALLARNEAALGNYAAAWRAQARLVELRGAAVDADELAQQADLMIRAVSGYVSPEAEAVLLRTLQQDPRHRQARYYLGLMFMQTDRPDRTFRIWSDLWTDSRASDPWAPLLERQLPDIAWLAGQHRYELPALRGAAPGPDAEAIDAAEELSPEARMEMVRGMVDGLAERLANQGGPAEDWARLISALVVLEETDRARAILAEAEQVFIGAPADLEMLRAAARRAGLIE